MPVRGDRVRITRSTVGIVLDVRDETAQLLRDDGTTWWVDFRGAQIEFLGRPHCPTCEQEISNG